MSIGQTEIQLLGWMSLLILLQDSCVRSRGPTFEEPKLLLRISHAEGDHKFWLSAFSVTLW